jgi:hypothetical protein
MALEQGTESLAQLLVMDFSFEMRRIPDACAAIGDLIDAVLARGGESKRSHTHQPNSSSRSSVPRWQGPRRTRRMLSGSASAVSKSIITEAPHKLVHWGARAGVPPGLGSEVRRDPAIHADGSQTSARLSRKSGLRCAT